MNKDVDGRKEAPIPKASYNGRSRHCKNPHAPTKMATAIDNNMPSAVVIQRPVKISIKVATTQMASPMAKNKTAALFGTAFDAAQRMSRPFPISPNPKICKSNTGGFPRAFATTTGAIRKSTPKSRHDAALVFRTLYNIDSSHSCC